MCRAILAEIMTGAQQKRTSSDPEEGGRVGRVASPGSLLLLVLSTNPVSCRGGELGSNRYTSMEINDAQMIRAVAAVVGTAQVWAFSAKRMALF